MSTRRTNTRINQELKYFEKNLPRYVNRLKKKNLSKLDLKKSIFNGFDLVNFNLIGTDLTRANLTRAILRDAKLKNADLTGAKLRNANLTSAKLIYAILKDADLTGANLRNANLTGADLTGADLTGAVLTGAVLTDMIFNKTTNNRDVIIQEQKRQYKQERERENEQERERIKNEQEKERIKNEQERERENEKLRLMQERQLRRKEEEQRLKLKIDAMINQRDEYVKYMQSHGLEYMTEENYQRIRESYQEIQKNIENEKKALIETLNEPRLRHLHEYIQLCKLEMNSLDIEYNLNKTRFLIKTACRYYLVQYINDLKKIEYDLMDISSNVQYILEKRLDYLNENEKLTNDLIKLNDSGENTENIIKINSKIRINEIYIKKIFNSLEEFYTRDGIENIYKKILEIEEDHQQQIQKIQEDRMSSLAYEVHNEFNFFFKYKKKQYLEIIETNDDTSNYKNIHEIHEYVREKFISHIYENDDISFEEKTLKSKQTDMIFDRMIELLKLYTQDDLQHLENNGTLLLIEKSLYFVFSQPPYFINEYIKLVINDSCTSYKGNVDTLDINEVSCPKGILERLILSVPNAAGIVCFKEINCSEIYEQLRVILKFPNNIEMNTLFQEWVKKIIEENKEEYKNWDESTKQNSLYNYIKNFYGYTDYSDDNLHITSVEDTNLNIIKKYVSELNNDEFNDFIGGKKNRKSKKNRKLIIY